MDDGISYELTRVRLGDGWETTVYLVRHPRDTTSARIVRFQEPVRLDHWCVEHGTPEAMVAGFFVRDPYRPLGEVRIDGEAVEHEPVADPWGSKRDACTSTAACGSPPATSSPQSHPAISSRPVPCSCRVGAP